MLRITRKSKARLNFHLTQSEKTNIAFALNSEYNKKSLLQVQQTLSKKIRFSSKRVNKIKTFWNNFDFQLCGTFPKGRRQYA